jgi:hypothetical protein
MGCVPDTLQPVDEHVEAGGEALVAVVDPDVLAEGDQGGKALGEQRAEELVELASGGCNTPATPGWASSTARSRCASTVGCWVHGWGGVEVGVDLGEHAVKDQVVELLFVAYVAVQRAGDHPRRVAGVRMVSAATLSWAMIVSAWATTRSRVWGRRSSSARGGRTAASVTSRRSRAAVARWFGGPVRCPSFICSLF